MPHITGYPRWQEEWLNSKRKKNTDIFISLNEKVAYWYIFLEVGMLRLKGTLPLNYIFLLFLWLFWLFFLKELRPTVNMLPILVSSTRFSSLSITRDCDWNLNNAWMSMLFMSNGKNVWILKVEEKKDSSDFLNNLKNMCTELEGSVSEDFWEIITHVWNYSRLDISYSSFVSSAYFESGRWSWM